MKSMFVSVLLLLSIVNTTVAARPVSDTVVVIGSIHSVAGSAITVETLYDALNRVKPDIIFLEYDSTDFVQCNLKVPAKYKWMKTVIRNRPYVRFTSTEKMAAFTYKLENKATCLLPCDVYIPQRSASIDYVNAQTPVISGALNRMMHNGEFPVADSAVIGEWLNWENVLREVLDSGSMSYLNSEVLAGKMREQYEVQREAKRIIDNHPKTQGMKDYFEFCVDYMVDFRNEAMCKMIERSVQGTGNKKVVVLCGAFHKPFISDYFKQVPGIVVREYNE